MLRLAAIFALLPLGAGATTLGFEGLPSTQAISGAPDAAAVLTDQFAGDGIIFGEPGKSAGVAVNRYNGGIDGTAATFGAQSIAGLEQDGTIKPSLASDTWFRFVDPADATIAAATDSLSFQLGDSGGDDDEFTIMGFDIAGNTIFDGDFNQPINFEVVIGVAGLHKVHIDFDDTNRFGYFVDDMTFNTPTVPGTPPGPAPVIPLPASGLLLLGAAGLLGGLRARCG